MDYGEGKKQPLLATLYTFEHIMASQTIVEYSIY